MPAIISGDRGPQDSIDIIFLSIKIIFIGFGDQKICEEQLITLEDLINLFFMCKSRGTYWGPEPQIQLSDLFVLALTVSFNKFLN